MSTGVSTSQVSETRRWPTSVRTSTSEPPRPGISQVADRLDLRLAPAAAGVWVVAAAGVGWSVRTALLVAGAVAATGSLFMLLRRSRAGARRALPIIVLVAAALAVAVLRGSVIRDCPMANLAVRQSYAQVVAVVSGDP